MLRMAVPLILAELGWMVMGLVDTIMVGRLPNSAEAIGAVSLGSVVFYTIGIFGAGLLLGLDTFVSQSFGAGDLADCNRSLISGLWMALLFTAPLMGVVQLAAWAMPRFGVAPEVLRGAVPYLRALNWSLPPLLLYFAFRRYLQAVNMVKPVTFVLVSANLVNLAGNYLFVYGHLGMPRLGVPGSAWSTVAARGYMAAFLLLTILYYNHAHGDALLHARWRPDWQRMAQLIRLGLPAASQIFLELAVFGAVTALISRLGAVPLAAHQVALNTASLTFMVPMGISSAAAVRVGQALGRNDLAGAARAGWTALLLGASFMGAAAITLFTVPRWIAMLYTPQPEVIALGARLLLIAAIFQIFDGVQTVAIGALRGAGNTRLPMACSLLAYWVIGLPLGYVLCFRFQWGAQGLWVGLCAGLIAIGSILLLAWRRQTRRWLPPSAPSMYHATSK